MPTTSSMTEFDRISSAMVLTAPTSVEPGD
jgi:hypothetical protein